MSSAFIQAAIILLREGLEAMLVIAARPSRNQVFIIVSPALLAVVTGAMPLHPP